MIPTGQIKLKTVKDAAVVAINSTSSSGQPPITDQVQYLSDQWQQLLEKLNLNQEKLKEKERTGQEFDGLLGEFLKWLEDVEIKEKEVEKKRDDTEEKKVALENAQVRTG